MICIIKLVQDRSSFEALQSRIKQVPVPVREMARKCGESGDFEVLVLTYFCVAAAGGYDILHYIEHKS